MNLFYKWVCWLVKLCITLGLFYYTLWGVDSGPQKHSRYPLQLFTQFYPHTPFIPQHFCPILTPDTLSRLPIFAQFTPRNTPPHSFSPPHVYRFSRPNTFLVFLRHPRVSWISETPNVCLVNFLPQSFLIEYPLMIGIKE